jgi:hypothetical protein
LHFYIILKMQTSIDTYLSPQKRSSSSDSWKYPSVAFKKPNLEINDSIHEKLDSFIASKKIPHIIFHGSSGSGKRTVVFEFLRKIYNNDKPVMKTNIMVVNCAHGGKGIKFIREDLKFFAKTNIKYNRGIIFKTVVLQNADFLTNDAQSALRRCIEEYSKSTRFFIIVENKNKLLNPILSRFCEIYFPQTCLSSGNSVNLHQYHMSEKPSLSSVQQGKLNAIRAVFDAPFDKKIEKINQLYSDGISALDVVEWIDQCHDSAALDERKKTKIRMLFHKVKHEFRCEKLLILYVFNSIERNSEEIDELLTL